MLSIAHRIVLADHARLPWRFFWPPDRGASRPLMRSPV
jgi:hypothetical protein